MPLGVGMPGPVPLFAPTPLGMAALGVPGVPPAGQDDAETSGWHLESAAGARGFA